MFQKKKSWLQINLDPVISSSDLDFSISDHLQRCWHYSATTQWDEIFSEGSVECLLFFENIVLFYMDFKMLLSMDFILLCLDLNILLLIWKVFLGWISSFSAWISKVFLLQKNPSLDFKSLLRMDFKSHVTKQLLLETIRYAILFDLMKTVNFSIQVLRLFWGLRGNFKQSLANA